MINRFGHGRVLEFYLNQVPYGGRRRGVVQAARYYFSRDVSALTPAEQLALVAVCERIGPEPCIERDDWHLHEAASSPVTCRTGCAA